MQSRDLNFKRMEYGMGYREHKESIAGEEAGEWRQLEVSPFPLLNLGLGVGKGREGRAFLFHAGARAYAVCGLRSQEAQNC